MAVDSDGAAMDSDDLAAAAGLHRLAAVHSDLGSVSDVAAAHTSERVAAVNSELAMEGSPEVMVVADSGVGTAVSVAVDLGLVAGWSRRLTTGQTDRAPW
jgi:hypothetical protein